MSNYLIADDVISLAVGLLETEAFHQHNITQI